MNCVTFRRNSWARGDGLKPTEPDALGAAEQALGVTEPAQPSKPAVIVPLAGQLVPNIGRTTTTGCGCQLIQLIEKLALRAGQTCLYHWLWV